MRKTILGSALCYLILLLALAALLLTSGSFWALAGLCLLLLLPLASWAVNFYVRRHLQADILTPATAAKRTAVSCRVRIHNGAFLPVMRYGCQVSVRNDLTEEDQTVTLTGSIGAKGESSQTILLQSSFCGRVYVQISRFTLLDYLGLLPMKALVKADARLTILPDLYPMEADMTARPAYADDGEIKSVIESVEKELGGDGRVLVRLSGTEPKIRVMLEGTDLGVIEKLADKIVDKIKERLL